MGKRQRQNKTKLKGNLPIVELTKVQRRCLDTSGLILVFASLIALNIGHSVNASSNGDGVIGPVMQPLINLQRIRCIRVVPPPSTQRTLLHRQLALPQLGVFPKKGK